MINYIADEVNEWSMYAGTAKTEEAARRLLTNLHKLNEK